MTQYQTTVNASNDHRPAPRSTMLLLCMLIIIIIIMPAIDAWVLPARRGGFVVIHNLEDAAGSMLASHHDGQIHHA